MIGRFPKIVLLTGSHGSGKSSLAEELTKGLRLPFYQSKASQIHEQFGVTAKSGGVPIELRLKIQQEIYNSWIEQMVSASARGGIFDRCPLDFIAYLLAEIDRKDTTEQEQIVIANYILMNMQVLKTMLADPDNFLFFVWPLTDKPQDRGDNKPSVHNRAYMWKVHYLIAGLLASFSIRYAGIDEAPVMTRVRYVANALSEEFAKRTEVEEEKRVAAT